MDCNVYAGELHKKKKQLVRLLVETCETSVWNNYRGLLA